jgi:hypothetical protein
MRGQPTEEGKWGASNQFSPGRWPDNLKMFRPLSRRMVATKTGG